MQESLGIGESVEVTVVRHVPEWLVFVKHYWFWAVIILIALIIFWSLLPKKKVYVKKEVSYETN